MMDSFFDTTHIRVKDKPTERSVKVVFNEFPFLGQEKNHNFSKKVTLFAHQDPKTAGRSPGSERVL